MLNYYVTKDDNAYDISFTTDSYDLYAHVMTAIDEAMEFDNLKHKELSVTKEECENENDTSEPNEIGQEDLDKINCYTARELSANDVFFFEIELCSTDVDNDYERFSIDALYDLEKLFLGKTGFVDNEVTGRIYSTKVVHDYAAERTYLKAKAFLIKSEKAQTAIKEIIAGIKEKVSISCGVDYKRCSICNKNIYNRSCDHLPGKEYDGKVCTWILENPIDAYEWAFIEPSAHTELTKRIKYVPKTVR